MILLELHGPFVGLDKGLHLLIKLFGARPQSLHLNLVHVPLTREILKTKLPFLTFSSDTLAASKMLSFLTDMSLNFSVVTAVRWNFKTTKSETRLIQVPTTKSETLRENYILASARIM